MSQKITTFLMFNDQAEQAMEFYTSLFKNGKIVEKYAGPDGKTVGGTFDLDGERYYCYNAGPAEMFKFTQGISLMIKADTQEEIDYFYDKLAADGGQEQPCGWVVDRFGVSWQVCPTMLMENLTDPDRARSERVTQAMFKMKKLILADLEAAAVGSGRA